MGIEVGPLVGDLLGAAVGRAVGCRVVGAAVGGVGTGVGNTYLALSRQSNWCIFGCSFPLGHKLQNHWSALGWNLPVGQAKHWFMPISNWLVAWSLCVSSAAPWADLANSPSEQPEATW